MNNKVKLFTPFKIGTIEIKNRIIVTAMHTGFSMNQETAFLRKRAEGGAGAVTATMGVSKGGTPFNMSIVNDKTFLELKKMADSVHDAGGKLIIQLFHTGRNGNTGKLVGSWLSPVAPSPISSSIYKEVPKEITLDEIKTVIKEFGKSALICRKAGVDMVEISCSAGYLLSEFLSTISNVRKDIYGGSLENRIKFPLEVIREVRKSVGLDYPIILRVSGSDMIGGYGIDLTIQLVSEAERFIDAINVTGGWHESIIPQISMHVPEGGFAFLAREVKGTVKIPVIACNRINNREIAEDILNEGYSDFVGCCRAFLIDSEFGNKIKIGKKYRKCIGCNSCIENVLKGDQVSCAFNPRLGNEFKTEKNSAKKNKKVLVIGGGPSGMEAALQYINKGYDVRICTKEESLGGLMKFAAKAPYKNAIGHNIKTMESEIIDAGVEVFCQTFVDEIYINDYHPDLVVVATGSQPVIPNIVGINREHVYLAQDILSGNRNLIEKLLAGKVLIIGGGSVGLETALYLINESHIEKYSRQFLDLYIDSETSEGLKYNSNVTIVEMNKLGQDLKSTRWITLKELERWNVHLMSGTKVEKILDKEVVTKIGNLTHKIEADYVVLAAGYQSVGKELVKWLEENKYEYKLIGDAKKVENISKAIKEAYELIH